MLLPISVAIKSDSGKSDSELFFYPLKKVEERRKPPGFAWKDALGPDGLRRAATFSTGCLTLALRFDHRQQRLPAFQLLASHRGRAACVEPMFDCPQTSSRFPREIDFLVHDKPGNSLLLMLPQDQLFVTVASIALTLQTPLHILNHTSNPAAVVMGKTDRDVIGVACVGTLSSSHYTPDSRVEPAVHQVAQPRTRRSSLRQTVFVRRQLRQQLCRLTIPADSLKVLRKPLSLRRWEEVLNIHLENNSFPDMLPGVVDDRLPVFKSRHGRMHVELCENPPENPSLNGFEFVARHKQPSSSAAPLRDESLDIVD